MWNISIRPIDRTLSDATTPDQNGPGSEGNERVLRISQRSSITGASRSDCLVPNRTLVGEVLPLCRCAVRVFCSLSRLNYIRLWLKYAGCITSWEPTLPKKVVLGMKLKRHLVMRLYFRNWWKSLVPRLLPSLLGSHRPRETDLVKNWCWEYLKLFNWVQTNHHHYHVVLPARISLTILSLPTYLSPSPSLPLSLSLSICLSHPLLSVGLPGYIMCPYKAVVDKFLLAVLHLCVCV